VILPIGLLHSVISRPSRCLSQYTAPILLCFPRHWASQPVHIWLADDGILGMPKHVGDCWIPIHWMINAFVGFSFKIRKCLVQNNKKNSLVALTAVYISYFTNGIPFTVWYALCDPLCILFFYFTYFVLLFQYKYGLSEHKHCDNAVTNTNSKNARSRIEASSAGKREYGSKRRWVKYRACFGCCNSPCYGPFSLGTRFGTY
jgi:hypothetical protein